MSDAPLLIRTYRGEKDTRPPVWFMRQAGRYLPEYRSLRQKHSMLEVIRTPHLAAEVTLQPVRRFDLDAAIIFADILNPLIGMGLELDFVKGEGPRILNPVSSSADVCALKVPQVVENSGYTLEAISLAVAKLAPKQVPLIGFCGAPFTLSCYIVQGISLKNFPKTVWFRDAFPEAWRDLQLKLVELSVEYLSAQASAGAAALQIFDSWLGIMDESAYERFAEPFLKQLFCELRRRVDVPLVFYSTGTRHLLDRFRTLGADVVGVDASIPLSEAGEILGSMPLQGNLAPEILAGPPEALEEEVVRILKEGEGLKSHIFNVGKGILPHTPPENVGLVVEMVRKKA